jgi:predicted DNA-binding transcriptional regulator YafY
MMLPLQQAIVARRVVRVRYGARGAEETVRDLEPLGVVRYADAWYLVGWCRLRKDFRHFKFERVRELETLAERFTPRPGFSLREHLDEGMAKERWIPARIWFADAVLDRARRESFVALTEEKRVRGGSEATVQTHSYEWLARWILSFGDQAEAISPPELRREVMTQAKAIARRYGENPS